MLMNIERDNINEFVYILHRCYFISKDDIENEMTRRLK